MGCFYLNPVWNFVINTWGIFLLWNVIMQECMCVCVCLLAEVCFDCFVLCFVMGYVLQFGETSHKRLCYHMYRNAYIDTLACSIACLHVCAHTHTFTHTHTHSDTHTFTHTHDYASEKLFWCSSFQCLKPYGSLCNLQKSPAIHWLEVAE